MLHKRPPKKTHDQQSLSGRGVDPTPSRMDLYSICLLLLSTLVMNCNGYSGVHYLNDDPTDGLESNDAFFRLYRNPLLSSGINPYEDNLPLLYVDSNSKNSGESSGSNLKKRSISKRSSEDDSLLKKFGGDIMAPMPELDGVKTIHFPSSFTPRFGKKRSSNLQAADYLGDSSPDFQALLRSSRLKNFSRKQQPPRSGRSSEQNKVQLSAGSAFTPRLGRSEPVRLQAGRVFTPRLGRSSDQQIQLNAGSAFTPRFGRSDNIDLERINYGTLNGLNQLSMR